MVLQKGLRQVCSRLSDPLLHWWQYTCLFLSWWRARPNQFNEGRWYDMSCVLLNAPLGVDHILHFVYSGLMMLGAKLYDVSITALLLPLLLTFTVVKYNVWQCHFLYSYQIQLFSCTCCISWALMHFLLFLWSEI